MDFYLGNSFKFDCFGIIILFANIHLKMIPKYQFQHYNIKALCYEQNLPFSKDII